MQERLTSGNSQIFKPLVNHDSKTKSQITSSIIIDHLERNRGHNNLSVAVVYIYCAYNEQKKQTAVNLMGSILRQLVNKLHSTRAELPYEITTLYQSHAPTFTRPSVNDYYNTIRKVACAFERIFVVVDALDECAESDELCSRIQDLLSMGNFCFLATSRPLKSIDEFFTGAAHIEIYAAETDVRRYLESQIQIKPRLRAQVRKNPSLSCEIIDKITQKTQGMYVMVQVGMPLILRTLLTWFVNYKGFCLPSCISML